MRLSLLALVVANIAFFGWANWIDTPAKVLPAADRDASIPPLQLMPRPGASAASTAAAAATAAAVPAAAPASTATSTAPPVALAGAEAAPAPTASTAGAAATRCRSLGPFEDANAADAAAEHLRAHGLNPRERSADTTNPNIYWVYIGELTSEMQRRAMQVLSAAGIHDAAAMKEPEQSDRVSVGMFADQAHAVRRAEQVRALGFKPTLGMRQRTVSAHWLDFDLRAADSDPQPADLLGGPTRPSIGLGPVKLVDCPANNASG